MKYFPRTSCTTSCLSREKAEMQAELDSLYLENIGEDILYLWVEKVDCIIFTLSCVTVECPLLTLETNTEFVSGQGVFAKTGRL